MATAVLCLSVLLSLCLAEREVLLANGAFNYPFVHDEDIRHSAESSTLYVTMPHRCVSVFYLVAEGEEDALVNIERITAVADNGEYTWGSAAETILEPGTEQAITASSGSCASNWRITIASKNVEWKDISFEGVQPSTKRAAVFCTYEATAEYPPDCSSASDGALCIEMTGQCGCKSDNDCFGNTDFPRCVIATGTTGVCDRCTTVAPQGGNNYNDHYFCRTRYPGFATHPTDTTPLVNERAAPQNYFREYCTRTPVESSGSCQRCSQAPAVPFPSLTGPQAQGASGTVHCSIIRPTTAPICMDIAYMALTGRTFDPNLRGACVPCQINPECNFALPRTPICDINVVANTTTCRACANNGECTGLPGKNCQSDGSCFSCTSNNDCGSRDGGETPGQLSCDIASGICVDPFQCNNNAQCVGRTGNNCQKDRSCLTCTSNSNCGNLDGGETPNQPVCDVASGICTRCTNNIDCVGAGGNNCQADGSCLTCTSDASCGNLDGGSTPNQPTCDTVLGICITPFSCNSNNDCLSTPNSGGNNCQATQNCVSCTSIATCGNLDGGETPLQPNCNLGSRLCVDRCLSNADCIGTQGNNCMNSGICVTCNTNADCNVDGGENPGQSICDTPTGICTSPCNSNSMCPSGQNCQSDGTCRACNTNNDCGVNDGGEIPGQPICQAGGICGPCSSNSDCRDPLPNCGANGQCYNCADVGNTCGAQDGPPSGIGANQERCDTEIGLCVDYCTLDEHCIDSCVPYCNVQKGCCVECKEDAHCPHSNWRGIEEGLNFCSVQSGVCTPGCLYDYDCTDEDAPACDTNTRTCVECVHDFHCEDHDDGEHCTDELECGDESDDARAIAIAALVLACLGFCLVLIVIGVIATRGAGPEHV